MMKCGICFAIENKTPNRISVMKSGVAFVSFDQRYKGWSVLASRKHVEDMRDLSEKEYREFWDDVKALANAVEKAFSPDKITYSVLMNVTSHLHCHVIPRYKSDPDWGQHFWPQGISIKDNDKKQEELAKTIKKFL